MSIRKMRFNFVKVDPNVEQRRRYEKEKRRIMKAKEKKRRLENQIRQDDFQKQLLAESESKRKERGLRGRIDEPEEIFKIDREDKTPSNEEE